MVLGWGGLAGMHSLGMGASGRLASHATFGIHPPAGESRRFSADSLRGRQTRPSREGSAGAHFRSSHSCV